MRSRAAAGILNSAGFKETFSMEGGINAWQGLVAEGPPESGMAYFSPASSTKELLALAWMLEDGNLRFYSGISEIVSDDKTRKLFGALATAEEHHKTALLNTYRDIAGKQVDADFPASILGDHLNDDVMEGGMSVSDALKWAKGRGIRGILELSISLETNAYDLYIKMSRHGDNDASQKVFYSLAEEERQHLNRFSAALDETYS